MFSSRLQANTDKIDLRSPNINLDWCEPCKFVEREEETEQLVVHCMEGQPAPKAVLDLLTCVQRNVFSQNVCVLHMASGVWTCVNWQTVRSDIHQIQCENSDEDVDDLENLWLLGYENM